jgi:hypothetical protein
MPPKMAECKNKYWFVLIFIIMYLTCINVYQSVLNCIQLTMCSFHLLCPMRSALILAAA